jgi:hypothetical protein
MDEEIREEIEDALLNAIWIMRWTENNEAMYAPLEPMEADQIVKDIFIELDKAGYQITKK